LSDSTKNAGIEGNALYLVRPDGYVALASSDQNIGKLKAFVEQFHLRFQNPSIAA
jgi:hypothetical protein